METAKDSIMTIKDMKTLFDTNIKNKVLSQTFTSDNLPYFNNSAYRGQDGTTTAFNKPSALPAADLMDKIEASPELMLDGNITKNGIVNSTGVYNAIKACLTKLNRVRKFSAKWLHQQQGSFVQKATANGIAAFKTGELSTLKEYSSSANNAVYGWTRDVNVADQSVTYPESTITKKAIIKINDIIAEMEAIYAAWDKIKDNEINYTFYTCHQNCHGSCHGNRGRR